MAKTKYQATTDSLRIYKILKFLKLEILKKIFLGLSLSLGFLWGIKGYLICNAIAYFISVYLNIVFASLQLKVSQRLFVNISIPYLLIIFILGGVLYYLQSIFQLSYNFV